MQPLRFLLTSRTQAPQRRFGSFILFAAVLAVSLSACGWRLQGTSRLPPIMTAAYVEAEDRYSEFNRALRDSLRASGARLTERRTEATAVVRILDEESGQRVLSVSARNTPEEYEIYYTVEYSVEGEQGELIPPQRLEMTRDYSYDVTAVLAKQREEAMLRAALARDLAAQVVRRIASL
ncbi:MAG TPA: LPS assembly lipoprotein LptE [Steroidobacter sp.]|nr:LPS assembly lipoprotein LptE [Steroidobacteraceae bacterium]HLS81688.1 LPS assembly lipoprotein LptE [Steroidobacter sp.]